MPTNVVDGLAGKVVSGEGPHIRRLSCVAGGAIAAGDLVKYSGADTVIRSAATTDEHLGYAERSSTKGSTAFASGDEVTVIALGSPCVMMVNTFGTVTRGKLAVASATPYLVTDAGALALTVRSAGSYVASRTGAGVVQLNPAGSA